MAKAEAKKPPSKTEIMTAIAEASGLNKKQVAAVFEALSAEIKKSMSSRGAGMFTIPGLVKVTKAKVPAKPAAKGVLNRFTGQLYDRPAKPASTKIKVRALKSLKDMA